MKLQLKVINIKHAIIFISMLISGCATKNISQDPDYKNIQWINFNWHGSLLDGHYYEKSTIRIPLHIDGVKKEFNAQFDLGADISMLYGNPFQILLKSGDIKNIIIDTTIKSNINGRQYPCINTAFSLDKVKFNNKKLAIYEDYGSKLSKRHIGTIGSDLFQNKILIIDYPNERLAILDTLPYKLQNKIFFVKSSLDQWGRMLIPININGRSENVLFDTGSSLFNLITDVDSWKEISNHKKVDKKIKVSSWGKLKVFSGSKINVPAEICNKKITGEIVFCDSQFSKNNFFWGIIGNSLFTNDIIILNYKEQKFGVVNTIK